MTRPQERADVAASVGLPISGADLGASFGARLATHLKRATISVVRPLINSTPALKLRFPDFEMRTIEIIRAVLPYTMTSPQRIAALCDAIRYIEANNVAGSFVECGVYRGGSSMAAALSFGAPRDIYLFDTFEGMPPAGIEDGHRGVPAEKLMARDERIRCIAPYHEVAANMRSTGYPLEKIHLVRGLVEATVPSQCPDQIALLRLDTDWYGSTKHELEHLYPRLSQGGVLIIDDYGHWTGARKAVDEYFGSKVLLHRIDYTGRLVVKS